MMKEDLERTNTIAFKWSFKTRIGFPRRAFLHLLEKWWKKIIRKKPLDHIWDKQRLLFLIGETNEAGVISEQSWRWTCSIASLRYKRSSAFSHLRTRSSLQLFRQCTYMSVSLHDRGCLWSTEGNILNVCCIVGTTEWSHSSTFILSRRSLRRKKIAFFLHFYYLMLCQCSAKKERSSWFTGCSTISNNIRYIYFEQWHRFQIMEADWDWGQHAVSLWHRRAFHYMPRSKHT